VRNIEHWFYNEKIGVKVPRFLTLFSRQKFSKNIGLGLFIKGYVANWEKGVSL